MTHRSRDILEAAFGIALLALGPVFLIIALATADWRYLFGLAICLTLLAMKQ